MHRSSTAGPSLVAPGVGRGIGSPQIDPSNSIGRKVARPVIKLIAFFKRKAGLSVEEFQEYWRTRHADLVIRQKGLRRYLQNHTLLSSYRVDEPVYDGVAEAWFDDTESLRKNGRSIEYRAVREDEANFIDPDSIESLLTNEVVIVDRAIPDPSVKMIAFLNKRPDVSFEFFQRYWRDTHGPIAARIPGNRRYVQCHVRPGIYKAGRTPVFDGIPICWFDDPEALRASGASPEYAATRADEPNFMISGNVPFVIASALEIEVSK
jgi:uncharacterized protein (TIGR02118 family)